MKKQKSQNGAVVITGASTGIGEAAAIALDRLGFQVFAGVRRAADAERLAKFGRIEPLFLEVTDKSSIAAAVDTVRASVGDSGIAGLVNNAGVAVAGPLEFLPLDALRHQFEVNVIGLIAVTQAFCPMLRQGNGRLINVGSVGGRIAMPFSSAYNGSKFALEALTDALRMELGLSAIPVALIEPGAIRTPIWEKTIHDARKIIDDMPPEVHEQYGWCFDAAFASAKKVAGRGSAPEVVADAIVHALTSCHPKTRYLVGSGAKVQATLVKILPDRTLDSLILSEMGIRSKKPRAASTLRPIIAGALVGGICLGLWSMMRRSKSR